MKTTLKPRPAEVDGFRVGDLVMFKPDTSDWHINGTRKRTDVFRVDMVGATPSHTMNCVVLENNGERVGYCGTQYIRKVGQAKAGMFRGYTD